LVTEIILETGQKLVVKNSEAFPIYKSVSDITQLDKRSGSYSKTLKIVGTGETNQVLGQLFDVNVIDTTFDINKKIRCDVYQDGVNVFPRAYFQLKRVIKRGDAVGQSVDYVEYSAIVYNDVVDFFKEMGNKELTDLVIATPDTYHDLSLTEIEGSYTHTYEDVYLYPRLFNQTLQYEVKDFYPAIFLLAYWNAIHEQNGFEYEFTELFDFNYQLDRLVIPFTGKYEASDEAKKSKGAELGTPKAQDPDASPVVEALPEIEMKSLGVFNEANGIITSIDGSAVASTYTNGLLNDFNVNPNTYFNGLSNVILDPTSGYVDPEFEVPLSSVYDVLIDFSFDLDLDADDDTELIVDNGQQLEIFVRAHFKRISGATTDFFSHQTSGRVVLVNGTELDLGSNVFSGIGNGVRAIPCEAGDKIELIGFTIFIPNLESNWKFDSTGFFTPVTPKLTITSINAVILPRLEYQEGVPVYLQDFIPKKIKQSDIVRSVCTMFNLLPLVDEDNPQKIKYIPRDKYYDTGREYDWSKKLARDKDFEVEFLPNVVSKSIELSYKDDKDPHNESYRGATGKTYGQLRYVFQCENTKGTDRREVVFSPTPMLRTLDSAVVPALPIAENDFNIRLLYYQGVKSGSFEVLEEGNIAPTQLTQYAAISHFNNHIFPTYDLNFGVCDFYFYQGIRLTSNNLFNNHYRRTFKQLNSGKRAIGYFDLKPTDIAVLNLNDRVYINNSWWNIEEIAFNAASRQLTKVTLISIDDELSINVVRSNEAGEGVPNRPPLGDIPIGDPVIVTPTIGIGMVSDRFNNTYSGNHPWIEVHGRGNTFGEGAGGLIIGNRNEVNAKNAIVVGDGKTVNADGIHCDKLFVDGKDFIVPATFKIGEVTQTGTSDPTFTSQVDGIGLVSFTRFSTGTYDLLFTTDAFLGKSVNCQISNGIGNFLLSISKRTDSSVRISTRNLSETLVDGGLEDASIVIEIFG
jgi:hypothetical protein